MNLTSIEAKSIRGLPTTNASIPVKARGLILCGPNGSGKSSVVDALELAIGRSPSLFPETAQGVNWDAAGPHIVDGMPDVHLKFSTERASVTIGTGVDGNTLPQEVQEWLMKARRASFVLRRHMLLGFISSQPGPRYRILEPFLNLKDFEILENDVKAKSDAQARALATALEQQSVFAKEISELFNSHDSSVEMDTLFATTKSELSAFISGDEYVIDDILVFESLLKEKLIALDNSKVFAELSRLFENCKFVEESELRQTAEALKVSIVQLESTDNWAETAANAELLARGKLRIADIDPALCPLCESKIDGSAVLKRIKERLVDTEEVNKKFETVKRNLQLTNLALNSLKPRLKAVKDEWKLCMGTELPNSFSLLVSAIDVLADATTIHDQLSDEITKTIEQVLKHLDSVPKSSEIESQLERIKNLDALSSIQKGLKRLDLIIRKHPARLAEDDRIGYAKEMVKTLAEVSILVETARKKAVQEVFDEVVETANRLYKRLHPGESIGNSRLEVRHAVSSSASLRSEFYGRTEDPRVHYSESHLDTLGLCFFLAIRLHEYRNDPTFNLLVIDDVLHSVDSEHRERFAELLAQEFAEHQVIVTTHDPILFNFLASRLPRQQFEFHLFTSWSLGTGPIAARATSDFQKISDTVVRNSLTQDDICAAIGRFMEAISRDLAERLVVSTPFSKRPTLEVLWMPIDTRLRQSSGFMTVGETILNNVTRNRWFRNQCGAHFNPDEAPLTHVEVSELASNITQLRDLLFCDSCGTCIARKTDNDWICECGKLGYEKKIKSPAAAPTTGTSSE